MSDSKPTNSLKLGRLVKDYQRSSANVAKVIIASLISFAIAALFFAGSVSNAMSGSIAGTIVLSIVGLLFLLPPFFGIYTLIRGRGASLSLYENGLIYRRGGKEFMTAWDEIASYIQETACRITKKNGDVIEFGLNIKDADEVAQRIQDETLRIMLPQVKAAALGGSSVQFKGLKPAEKAPLGAALDNFMRAFSGFTVDSRGIAEIDGNQRIEWDAVTDFGVGEEQMGSGRGRRMIDVFFVQDANTTFRTRYGLLENAHVLL